MLFSVIRGEYPFSQVVNVVDAPEDEPGLALEKAKTLYALSPDVFLRHPVVEPLE